MKLSLKQLFLLTLLSGLAACTTAPPPPPPPLEEAEVAAVEQAVEEEIEYGTFSEEQLYQTIISELGAQRGDLEDAGDNYLDLAMETRDLGMILRAVQFASVNGDVNALMQLGLLWAEIEPENPQPHLSLAYQFLEDGNYNLALSHMARVIDLGGEMGFTALAARTGRLDPRNRQALIENLRQLAREFEEEESIHVALVQLLAQNRQFDDALYEMQLLLQNIELTPNMVLLHGQILQNMDDTENALRVMRSGVREFSDDKALRLSYARLLIQDDRFEDAQEQFEIIVEQDPEDWETLYSVALLDMELENFDSAIVNLEKLIRADQRFDESQYYLGFIYEQREDYKNSIEHYRQVRIGTNNFLAAQQQATRHSINLGELDDAHAWLMRQSSGQPRLEILFTTIESNLLIQADYITEAKDLLDTSLNRFPNESDLLFARVLFYDSQSDREGSERDLQQIIRMQPDDSRALNHLGYMLADQTTRFEEALDLIERAIAISPDDPAIIDSLGWAQYKLGRYEEALANLRRAFEVFPDHEVASHVGEVLWMMGREDEATQVWEDALEERPDSELIREVMDRLRQD
ncbi:MAG: tetratricopeptide repeat protein [Pseudomonadales bacterium]|nr:tetratricopeptide repeat protein [Pseudomonadales bacterium]